MPEPIPPHRSHTLPLYVGGFLGPFGGAVLAVLIPELRDAFDATTTEIALAVPAYLVPFAVLQLVSGTLAERIGRRRVVTIAYTVYAGGSIGAALAPGIEVFLACRGIQGTANAFTSPVLLAGLADAVPPRERGRAVGTFAGVQAGGISLAPLLGGIAAEITWRLAFIVPAIVALALIAYPPPPSAHREGHRPRLVAVFTRRVMVLCAAGFAGYVGMTGLGFLVSLRSVEAFGMGSTARGLLLAAFGLAGMVLGRAAGRASERIGAARSATIAACVCSLAVGPMGVVSGSVAYALLWFGAGCGAALLWAGLNTVAVEAVPANRAGAVSVFAAFKFAGTAVAPLVWLPVYTSSPAAAFACAAITLLAIVPLSEVLSRSP
ncbi:MAG: MFS transporter [Gaiellales bacterium]